MNNRLRAEQKFYIVEVASRDIQDICARLDPEQEWYVGQSQHDGAEERLAMLVDLREKMLRMLRTRGTALHYLKGDTKPAFRDKLLAEKFKKAS